MSLALYDKYSVTDMHCMNLLWCLFPAVFLSFVGLHYRHYTMHNEGNILVREGR